MFPPMDSTNSNGSPSVGHEHVLQNHERMGTGERPYACDVSGCHSKFSDSNQLKAHRLVHKKDKPFVCDKCLGKFPRRHHLTFHKCPTNPNTLRVRRQRAYEKNGASSTLAIVGGGGGSVSEVEVVGGGTGIVPVGSRIVGASGSSPSSPSPSTVHHLLRVESPISMVQPTANTCINITINDSDANSNIVNNYSNSNRSGPVHSISGSLKGDKFNPWVSSFTCNRNCIFSNRFIHIIIIIIIIFSFVFSSSYWWTKWSSSSPPSNSTL